MYDQGIYISFRMRESLHFQNIIIRKIVLDVAGNVDLEGSWDQLQLQTGRKLESCFL